jgi:hypothetical protein
MSQLLQQARLALGIKQKARPTKAELLAAVEQHFSGCGCESDTHTIHETVSVNGYRYTYTITRTVRPEQGTK